MRSRTRSARATPALLASALAQAVFFDWMCGREADERQLDRALELERGLGSVGRHGPPSEAAGLYLMGMGRLDEAQLAFERALARAEAEGVEYMRGGCAAAVVADRDPEGRAWPGC